MFLYLYLKYQNKENMHYARLPSAHLYMKTHMGEISQGVQSLNLMSYLSGVLGPFFGDLGLCYGKN